MSDDDSDDGGAVLPFPRVVLPGSFDAPDRPGPRPDFEADPVGGEPSPSGALPRLPAVSPMGPPLHLSVPGTPEPVAGDEEGAFAPPLLQDPDNPSGRDTVQLAMALMTALGVAAAQGMWHRARHRQALADQARAHADRAQAKAGGTAHRLGSPNSGHGGGRGRSKGGGLLTGSRHEGAGSRRRDGGSGHSGGGGHRTKDPKRPKDPKSPHSDNAHKRRGKDGHKAPKSTRGGRRTHAPAGHGPKRRKRGKTTGGLGDGPCVQTRKRRPSSKDSKAGTDDSKRKNGKNTRRVAFRRRHPTHRRRSGAGKQTSQPRRTLRWKVPRASKPGPGGDKALASGRKRWTRTAPGTSKPSTRKRKRGSTNGKGRQGAKRSRKSRFGAWSWRSTPGWVKRWRTRRKTTASSSTGSPGATGARGARGRESWTRSEPPPWSEWMRPPPWADQTVRVTVERVDDRPWPRPEAPAITVGQAALTAGDASFSAGRDARSAPSSASAPDQQGAPIVSMPVRTTQYADADLTIYDVIEADADMAEEITDGVADARATADGCERLMTRLEALYAEISDLKVPGVLLGMMAMIMDKTQTVKARAEAIAANLPAAAEAISVAGTNAAARHKGLADAVRDAGHTRPAERPYHDE